MDIVVQKFGGSSVADKDKLFQVCTHIIEEIEKQNKVVVVVSAQGKTTDRLIQEAEEISKNLNKREYDVLVSTGEQITIAKLAMCLKEKGYSAISLTGWQVPIITDENYTSAKIEYIDVSRIIQELKEKDAVIIAGFQGISQNGDITTLGRGGSDTTAVAIAAVLKANKCEIFTDVDGVYTSDPRKIEKAKKIERISYEEMLELASLGAKVLHNRCVEIGKKHEIPIYVKSTFEMNDKGTLVCNKPKMETLTISGVTREDNVTRIIIESQNTKIGRTYKVFDLLAKENINVDIIVKAFGEHKQKDIAFTIDTKYLEQTLEILDRNQKDLEIKNINYCRELSKISLVGIGIKNNPGVAARLFRVLYENNINMHMVSTSEIKISILVNTKEADLAMKKIHDEFIC